MNIVMKQPSEKSRIILSSLKEAVANALEKKRKLGQYAVVWEDNKLIYKGEDAPQVDSK
ncbi:hypothetical protein [Methylobacter psychrophilus]|uniref:hypothetical protein n=1 Tax=Methylobacter psychrophilus TaxID=96941 RepID=UPI0021D4F62E|nr:hypothetical protein [Methylobacter psychrophilus]